MARPALLALIVVLPLTLGLRAAEHGERVPNQAQLAADAVRILADGGWSPQPPSEHFIGWLVAGSQGNCRILINFPSPGGQSDEKFRIMARAIGPVTYRYRGTTSDALPRIDPMLAGHLQRYAWGFGIAIPTAPLIVVARSPACGARSPDLTGLRQHLQVARLTPRASPSAQGRS